MTLEGLDVSQYQATTPGLAGRSFLIARATYDVHPDSKYQMHAGNAKGAGLVVGAYHYITGRSSVAAQASAFLAAAAGADLLFVDFEGDAVPASASNVQMFIKTVQGNGRKIGLYHSESGFPELGQDFDWVAHWGVAAPTRHWDFHQYTSDGSLPGYAGRVDLDRFNGDEAALDALAGITAAPRQPVDFIVAVRGRTPVYDHPGGRILGYVSKATYRCHRSTADGKWWYHITGPATSRLVGDWLPAEPWMAVRPVP